MAEDSRNEQTKLEEVEKLVNEADKLNAERDALVEKIYTLIPENVLAGWYGSWEQEQAERKTRDAGTEDDPDSDYNDLWHILEVWREKEANGELDEDDEPQAAGARA